ncbi:MAG TPA: transcriptional repressor LexA [Aggregatilineales bacterium]|nr:transcriptional repressor LexA [Aggregatilineales bacterium]
MDLGSLSERQKAIYKFIHQFSDKHGYPPTIREIGAAVNINSTSVVNYNLNKLVKEGFISRSKDVSRGIRVVAEDKDTYSNFFNVPMVGQIMAGQPTPHPGDDFGYYYDEESTMPVPRALIGNTDPSEIYALTVSGFSMIDAMINEGDIVVLKRQDVARNGEMVAVWLNERGETTLKRFFDEGDRVRLQPANTTMDPIYVDKGKVEIQGKVLAVLRRVD